MKSLLATVTLLAVTLTWVKRVEGQSDVEQSLTFWKLGEQDKIINIAQYLAANDDTTRKVN
jgi:hypothetical protein